MGIDILTSALQGGRNPRETRARQKRHPYTFNAAAQPRNTSARPHHEKEKTWGCPLGTNERDFAQLDTQQGHKWSQQR